MLSIAALAAKKGVLFDYYVRYIPPHALENRSGNLALAKTLGMRLHVQAAPSDEALGRVLAEKFQPTTLFIPQGAATHLASMGIEQLACEIMLWKKEHRISNLAVATPSGTGTTALWLQKALDKEATVFTTPVVSDSNYLRKQWQRLDDKAPVPTILETTMRYGFGKPHADLLQIYKEVLQSGLEMDLVYAPVMLQALSVHRAKWEDKTLLYVHSGGVLGNPTQLARYPFT